jgi:hypothetical protein
MAKMFCDCDAMETAQAVRQLVELNLLAVQKTPPSILDPQTQCDASCNKIRKIVRELLSKLNYSAVRLKDLFPNSLMKRKG